MEAQDRVGGKPLRLPDRPRRRAALRVDEADQMRRDRRRLSRGLRSLAGSQRGEANAGDRKRVERAPCARKRHEQRARERNDVEREKRKGADDDTHPRDPAAAQPDQPELGATARDHSAFRNSACTTAKPRSLRPFPLTPQRSRSPQNLHRLRHRRDRVPCTPSSRSSLDAARRASSRVERCHVAKTSRRCSR
jgi:hypothetical protein